MKGKIKMTESSTGETTQQTTASQKGYDVFVPEIWSQKLNALLEKECVMLQCVNRNYEGEIANQGDTVKIITNELGQPITPSVVAYDEQGNPYGFGISV